MSSFTEFLRSKQNEEQAESAGLEKRKSEWLDSLNELFMQIEEWLSEPLSQNLITLKKEIMEFDEYKIGSYRASRLILQIGYNTVYIEPVGTIIVGAKGRVDVKTSGTSFKLILANENSWGILQPDRIVAEKLNQSTFTRALQDLLS